MFIRAHVLKIFAKQCLRNLQNLNAKWAEVNAKWAEVNAKWAEVNAKWAEVIAIEDKWMQVNASEYSWI